MQLHREVRPMDCTLRAGLKRVSRPRSFELEDGGITIPKPLRGAPLHDPRTFADVDFSVEFVRQIVKDEPGVTEWVRQQPGKRRYRVLRVP